MTFQLETGSAVSALKPNPGGRIQVRGSTWKVVRVEPDGAANHIHCVALTGIARGKHAIFIDRLEPDLRVLDPTELDVTPDASPGFIDTKLYLEAAFRTSPYSGSRSLVLGRAAIDDLEFQHEPVRRALSQPRVRLLIADDVGLGKTLEAGLVASELALRRRADRILVVTTRAMLNQFQREFWTRFSIPLARLDSSAIRRMKNALPASYNVFQQFDRAIVSVDTLKRDSQYRLALEQARWDLIIIDEAHNVAARKSAAQSIAQRAKLARLLARRADALLLLTATPHDGSAKSFSSLIEMLDPTRVPDAETLARDDIEDLVIRRFRSSESVIRDMRRHVPERRLEKRAYDLGSAEDDIYRAIAKLKLDLDGEGRKTGLDLFKVTLAKAMFSSPVACAETIANRLKRIASGQAKGSSGDVAKLETIGADVDALAVKDFGKYAELLKLLKSIRWTGNDKTDRLVIFSERIATLNWLADRLASDLGLAAEAIGKVDGSSVEADERTQKILEDFQQENAPIRILLASDMASEGLNLHFQCHRLIHFDLPWSLLRFQQRNGRIDRYGQSRQPEIYYFVGKSAYAEVKAMWVLDKLVDKDKAAQAGIGDPAVFLRGGDAEGEEEVVADAIGRGIGAEAFEKEMDARAETEADDWDLLFGAYNDAPVAPGGDESAPPRLYADTFSFADALLRKVLEEKHGLRTDHDNRLIRFVLPDDMRTTDPFGYAAEGDVDERYMPVEAVGAGERITLTDHIETVDNAIEHARVQERPWPDVQYLWDVHPIVSWMNERAEALIPQGAIPMCKVSGGLTEGQAAALLHSSCTNNVGAPVLSLWSVAILENGAVSHWIDDVPDFLRRIGFDQDTPNRGAAAKDDFKPLLKTAVNAFQTRVVEARRARQLLLDQEAAAIRERLAQFRHRFDTQLELQFAPTDDAQSAAQRGLRERRRDQRKRQTEEMFRDWENWIATSCVLTDDPNPYVDVKAVFRG